MIVMEPTLDVLHRTLQGDAGARTFLDRTCAIYVLDATDLANPKTYACWNFIQQAMNEIERVEAATASSPTAASAAHQLQGHVQLLANMALRVARRSNALDKQLVATCISNAAKYNASPTECQRLVDLNLELRDIVMGRIAAMVFDESYHIQGPTGSTNNSPSRSRHRSAFSDPGAMETFCAVLAANAVSNGPAAVNHLVTEWMVPSARTMPPYALACVTLHLADEALRKSAPAQTQDMLQRLSNSVMAFVLSPILSDAVKETHQPSSAEQQNAVGGSSLSVSQHEQNNRIAAICLRAMDRWCTATELSLAQIKHICSKVQINIVDVIGDAMYSDSGLVIDALAEWIEAVVQRHEDLVQATAMDTSSPKSTSTTGSTNDASISEERMTQVRYIMQVDEESFKSNISSIQLVTIESKEMESILEELSSAIGLQRFRFVERQNSGDHDVCRNLTRIAASVCVAVTATHTEGQPIVKSGPGLLDLLLKAATHPSVNICAISLSVLSTLIPRDAGLSYRLLPTLQRRAITPHRFVPNAASPGSPPIPTLTASDVCGVNVYEFQNFRESVLKEALLACWKDNGNNYMSSCTSAIEEFCASAAAAKVAFHLEAALFCMTAVADEALGITKENDASAPANFAHTSQLERCTTALAAKPSSLMSNPKTLSQLCQFLRKYDRWYSGGQVPGAIDIATELALTTFNLSATNFPMETMSVEMRREASVSPYKESALALKQILSQSPQHFLSNQAIAALGAGWEASFSASNHPGILTADDRQALCSGICHVLASLPDSQRAKSLHALAMPALDCLETMSNLANQASTAANADAQLDVILDRVADEVKVLTTMARSFTDAYSVKNASMESGCRTSDGHAAITEPAFSVLRKAWPTIQQVATKYSCHEGISEALGQFMTESLPPQCQDNHSVSLVKEICTIATSMLQPASGTVQFRPVLEFLQHFVKIHGDVVDKNARTILEGQNTQSNGESGRAIGECLESLLLATVESVRNSLGTTWTSPQRQGQGQPAFESKIEPMSDQHSRPTNDALPVTFSLLRRCAERCPFFLLHLPAGPGLDRKEDSLYRRSVESAVASLIEADVDTSKSAMEYLESTVKLTQSFSDDVRHGAEEVLSRVQSDIILMLVAGSCGKLNYATLGDAASLLSQVLTVSTSSPSSLAETQSNVVQALKHDHFWLGSKAQNVSLDVLMRSSRNEISASDLSTFLAELWGLHQIEHSEALEGSELVERFCRKFAS